GNEDVCRLDVAMNDALGMCGIERVRDLDTKLQYRPDFQPLRIHHVLECLALEQFHDNESAVLDFIDVIDRANVWVIKSGRSPGFASQALERLRRLGKLLRQEFERNE